MSAAALKPFALSGEQWDQDGMLLGCANGIVDLRTGWFRDGTATTSSRSRPGRPIQHAACPRWMQFLDEVFNGDAELIDYIWRAIGY